ncbi:zinc-dependent alcohol dehydrogenase [Ancylobacter terrae]|uniref:zinc-dependent alcohol dehydrogenase n=1 Tax=Ancylobacter sp. sgz301288 TaxID=3342077 RepID=UPI00385FA3D3
MRAVRLHAAGDLRVEDVPRPPELAPGWVRVGVEAAGICGSDIHNFRTGQWITRAPSIAGHEFAGRILALGAGVEGLAPGQRVVADSRFWCGECPACRAGRRHLCTSLGFVGETCDGGFAEQVLLPARLVVTAPEGLDAAVAAMAEPLAVALHAVNRLAPPPGRPVLVLGCGPIGGLAALLLARRHDGPLLVADRNAARAALVAAVTGARVVTLAGDAIAEAGGGGPVSAIEATGSAGALAVLVEALPPGGSVALVGIFHSRLDIDPNLLVEKEMALIGCHAFVDELAEAVTLLPTLAADMARFVDAEIGLDAVPDAYRRLAAGEGRGLKTIIRIGTGEAA